ncbi:Gfo/Idh/MocA family protein [Flavihumibacter petaseus]|uniref:Putative oxidoreductase n=1 Tax=Flavihumibacter petaseus NBRC 106054 TaxID=1220578 RepID=A0A0E9N039_9BACT|nr:Gfo/Idh/MocA family oxidoreductase [Flavihumibacter petaseus]GAO43148.1 putative oxidoreductase [Flavihumibacter petaseus NBRC 106054]
MQKFSPMRLVPHLLAVFCLLTATLANLPAAAQKQALLRVGVAGLSHDHAHQVMSQFKKSLVEIVGIVERDHLLVERYKKTYDLPDSLFYNDLTTLIMNKKPDAVLAYNAINEHLAVVEACIPKGVPVMVEKPLATTMVDADKIATLSRKHKVPVLTNYETTWYNSNQFVYSEVKNKGSIGAIRKMVAHDGHEGPKEIGCSAEFLNWLTDPVGNGGGASRDFGCYGANLMTWLMDGRAPISVTATIKRIKPNVYPKVDDDAVIVLEYPDAIGIIEASWNWPYSIKDLEVFGVKGYLQAQDGNRVRQRSKDTYQQLNPPITKYTDNIQYLQAYLRGEVAPGVDLSSLENNLIVVKILDAATRSAASGQKVKL